MDSHNFNVTEYTLFFMETICLWLSSADHIRSVHFRIALKARELHGNSLARVVVGHVHRN